MATSTPVELFDVYESDHQAIVKALHSIQSKYNQFMESLQEDSQDKLPNEDISRCIVALVICNLALTSLNNLEIVNNASRRNIQLTMEVSDKPQELFDCAIEKTNKAAVAITMFIETFTKLQTAGRLSIKENYGPHIKNLLETTEDSQIDIFLDRAVSSVLASSIY